ncbi:MAG: alpha-amylase family glycosyl hydrolase, partial [Candidatus Neomarinimicrobiota bacterium]
ALLQVLVDNTLLTDQEVDQKPDGSVVVNVSGWEQGLLRISGLDGAGRVIPENQTIIKNGRLLDCNAEPDDWHFAVLYSLMVDRFLDGDPVNTSKAGDADLHPLADFHGGDIAGINAKLEEGYFRDLGINAIWISPVSRQPEGAYVESIPPNRKFTGYHGYWPVRAREVDPRFGSAGELRRLVELAHEQDIRVILDFVSNHVHEEHEYCQSHPEWFGSMYLPDGTVNIRNWSNETRLTTWFDEFIPSFDYPAAPAAEDQVVEDALWWLETFNFDGFRQDAVKHVPHTFWKKLTAAMKTRFPERDFYQIGESFGSDELIKSYVNPGELNSQFNFAIYFNARGPFSADQADFGYLANILQDNRDIFGPVNLMGNLTSSHDQVRFMGFADGQMSFGDNGTERAFNDPPGAVRNGSSYDKLVNFTAFNLAIPGVPVIYYGEEIGLMGAADPDNRRPLRFAGELTAPEKITLARIAALTRLRRQYPALSIGDYIPLLVDGPLLVFGRIYFDERIIVAFNQSAGERTVTVDLPFPATGAVDLLNDETMQIANRQLELTLPAYGHRIVILN